MCPKERKDITCCANTASCVFNALTGNRIEIPYMWKGVAQGVASYDDNLSNFVEAKDDFSKEFWQITKPVHQVYLFSLEYGFHNFIIVKYVGQTGHYWLILQAWLERYSLQDWIHKTKVTSENPYVDVIKEYGNFRKIKTRQELLKLMQNEMVFDYNLHKDKDEFDTRIIKGAVLQSLNPL